MNDRIGAAVTSSTFDSHSFWFWLTLGIVTVQLRKGLFNVFSSSVISCCLCSLFNIKIKPWKLAANCFLELCHPPFQPSPCFVRVLLASSQILQDMSALFHVHVSLLRCHWITQAEYKTIRNVSYYADCRHNVGILYERLFTHVLILYLFQYA